MKVLVLGGDGFCGWPTSLHLSSRGHDVLIVDSLVRRAIDTELGANSLTPIQSMATRTSAWKSLSGQSIGFAQLDIAKDYAGLLDTIRAFQPDGVVHFAEQRSAPYSMKSSRHRRYTVEQNVAATHNVLSALAESHVKTHLVHLGTMGVYGYGASGEVIPEGYLERGEGAQAVKLLHPMFPGSIYHMTKCLDEILFQYHARQFGLTITDLHQGVVWGTQTPETAQDDALLNRFDYDGDYGTVFNRFAVQSQAGIDLTVHGSGGQTRAFIHIEDTVQCVRLALENPPDASGAPAVRIFNQFTQTVRVIDIANMFAEITGAKIAHVENPRTEKDSNELAAVNDGLLRLGLKPTLVSPEPVKRLLELADRFQDRIIRSVVPCRSYWRA